MSAMTTQTGTSEYDAYLRLNCEYQDSISRCLDALKSLKQTERELRELAPTLNFDPSQINAASKIENSVNQVIGKHDGKPAVSIEDLSSREREVFRAIGDGKSAQQIARRLGVAVSTVETYRERLKQKLDLANGVALTRCAILWAAGQSKSVE
jgi:DNA-binding NarL/FixJ family response regulator